MGRERMPLWPFALASVLIAIAVSMLAAWPWIEAQLKAQRAPPDEALVPRPVVVSIGDQTLTVPRDLVRFSGQRRDGAVERLELALRWPPHESAGPELTAANSVRGTVFITLGLPDDSLDPTRRLAAIYQRFLDQDVTSTPQGLASRRFVAESGYEGEELFYDPASPTAYFVRCAPPIADQPGSCLREFRLMDRLDVVYRFPRDLLTQWRRLDQAVSALLAAIGASGR